MHTIKDVVKQLIGKSLDAYNKKYTSPINNRIDNIVAQAGTDNTEIVDARIDSAGVSHTTLNNRILAETKMTDEKLIEYSGSSLSVDDTMPGYLQNIEIKGNTIQNEDNLEDIRSVGNKIEGQEIYEIPVLSCGKNLFNLKDADVVLGKLLMGTGELNISGGMGVTGYIPVKAGQTLNCSGGVDAWYGGFYDTNKVWKKAIQTWNVVFDEDGYYRVSFRIDATHTAQIEFSNTATPYEPYVEDKLTILSPVQLEKVGDVADRIICKDGVWGVEKNVETVVLDGNTVINNINTTNFTNINYVGITIESMKTGKNLPIICNRFITESYVSSKDYEYVYTWLWDNKPCIYIHFLKSKASTITEFKQWLQSNNTLVKYQLATPQFIPLPHDQQVKLRTFANKTNISFLTEIEGTIKAQVPKSLGATVNTHTEQISNLNKELDRVKKLEESTVSTVETESDFTTVEATSNGYFDDVKLEGKTLVNLCDFKGVQFTLSEGEHYNDLEICDLGKISLGKDYTFMFDIEVISNTTTGVLNSNMTAQFGVGNEVGVIDHPTMYVNGSLSSTVNVIKSHNVCKINITDIKSYSKLRFRPLLVPIRPIPTGQSIQYKVKNMILLEGDHTQNPPSYFEGLKSVGQNVDEIVVSSVKGDGNLISSECKVGTLFEVYTPKGEYVASCKSKQCTIRFYRKDKTLIDYWSLSGGEIIYRSFTTQEDIYYVLFDGDTNTTDIQLIKGNTPKPYVPYQTDKKRLLYYNNETQTWEKPVLREWDSIEKHADGKYYYHQRSGEVVLNGSEDENWTMEINTNTIRFVLSNKLINPIIKQNNLDIVCDKFDAKYNFNLDEEGIFINTRDNSANSVYIRLLKSKLSTQDVQGFKQWLQANNVTLVYQLAEEKVYECTNIDLITYANETNYIVESGVIVPRTTLKVHNNISNVVSLLQKKVSLLESNMTKYMITQNRLMLTSRYNADSVTFKVDYSEAYSVENKIDEDLFNLLYNVIIVGKNNYNYDEMFNIISDYVSWNKITWEHFDILSGIMQLQHDGIENSEEI